MRNRGDEQNSTTLADSSRVSLWRERTAEDAGVDNSNATKSNNVGAKKKTKLGIEYIPSKVNLMNTPGHEEMLIEIYTYLTLEFAHTIAVVDKRFCEVTKTCKWLPQTLLFTWGKKNHGHGQSSISKPKLLQRLHSIRSQINRNFQQRNILLTHGKVYCFGEIILIIDNVMHHPQLKVN